MNHPMDPGHLCFPPQEEVLPMVPKKTGEKGLRVFQSQAGPCLIFIHTQRWDVSLEQYYVSLVPSLPKPQTKTFRSPQ